MTNTNLRAPLAVGWVGRRAREVVDFVGGALAARGLASDRRGRAPNVPPRRLRARTGAPGAREFVQGGAQAAAELCAVLETSGFSLSPVASVLDFGCGSGRVLPHMARLAPGAVCAGADVDPHAIRWARRHIPELRWDLSSFAPPLPFAEQSLDLVYSISVFSHLDEQRQDDWLHELRRILRPGGLALLSVHGHHAFEQFRTGHVSTAWCGPEAFARAPLRPGEFVFTPYRRSVWNAAELPGVGPGYGLAFHGHGYLAEHWARMFEITHLAERAMTGWQDVVVCRKA